ncbi:hypothetical protein D3C73_773630 [compost metagenome]
MEKNTIAQGAPFTTSIASTLGLFLAIIRKNIATIPATADTGMFRNSLTKYPASRTASTIQDNLNICLSLMASSGFFSCELSKFLGMLFLNKRYRTRILAPKENRVGISIRPAYSIKVTPKKSADTIFTRLLTTSGNEVVSAMNPPAMMNGKTFFSSKFSARTIASTIGVRMSAAPSLAKNAATTAPRSVMKKNIRVPLPRAALATCKAAHSKKPILSRIKEIRIIATKANVAFQTIRVTSITSLKRTTPASKASIAPPQADHPMDRFLGCQMTNTSVTTKIRPAKISKS